MSWARSSQFEQQKCSAVSKDDPEFTLWVIRGFSRSSSHTHDWYNQAFPNSKEPGTHIPLYRWIDHRSHRQCTAQVAVIWKPNNFWEWKRWKYAQNSSTTTVTARRRREKMGKIGSFSKRFLRRGDPPPRVGGPLRFWARKPSFGKVWAQKAYDQAILLAFPGADVSKIAFFENSNSF